VGLVSVSDVINFLLEQFIIMSHFVRRWVRWGFCLVRHFGLCLMCVSMLASVVFHVAKCEVTIGRCLHLAVVPN